MALSLESLEVLDAIERKGSFAAAAHELGKVPSALTYVVRKLEDDLDVLLFDRRRHRAELTPAGRALLDEGRHLLQAADDLARRVKRLATGWEATLTIVVDDLVHFRALMPVIQDFYAENTATRLRFCREVLAGTWDALLSGRADLLIGPAQVMQVQGIQTRTVATSRSCLRWRHIIRWRKWRSRCLRPPSRGIVSLRWGIHRAICLHAPLV